MANYYATTRSNYFRVKDAAAFEAWCKRLSLDFWSQTLDGLGECHAISADTADCSGWSRLDPATDEFIDLPAELAAHLAPTDIAILVEIGSEKLRYLCGYATAIAPDGRTISVSINDIDERAHQAFPNRTITEARY